MKILVLSPHAELWKKWIPDLSGLGAVTLYAEDPSTAWAFLQFHGAGVELAVIHRESRGGMGEEGLALAQRMRRDPAFAEIPIILTSEAWQERQFKRHQDSKDGFNAYIAFPYELEQLFDRVEGVLGMRRDELRDSRFADRIAESEAKRFHSSTDTRVPHGEVSGGGDVVLEDVSVVFNLEDSVTKGLATSSFHLDMPLPPDSDPIRSAADRERRERIERERQEHERADSIDLPYLFGGSGGSPNSTSAAQASFPGAGMLPPPGALGASAGAAPWSLPLGHSIIPGASSGDPDVETLKKFLTLREHDVAALGAQLKLCLDQLKASDDLLKMERARAAELSASFEAQKARIEEVERAKQAAAETFENEIARLRGDLKGRSERARQLELQVRERDQEVEKVKDRVRQDLRQIRQREKELETQLEILKKDSVARLQARESTVIDLKRKLDLLEFNTDILQEQIRRERENSGRLKLRLAQVAEAVKTAGGLLVGGVVPSEELSESSEGGSGMPPVLGGASSPSGSSRPPVSEVRPPLDLGGGMGSTGSIQFDMGNAASQVETGQPDDNPPLELIDSSPGSTTGLIQLDLPDDENKAS